MATFGLKTADSQALEKIQTSSSRMSPHLGVRLEESIAVFVGALQSKSPGAFYKSVALCPMNSSHMFV